MYAEKRFLSNRIGLAMVNMLIFVIIFTVLSGIMMTIVSSSTRLLERHIRRTKAFYLTEGAAVYAIDWARRSGWAGNWVVRPNFQAVNFPWVMDSSGSPVIPKTAFATRSAAASGPNATYQVNGTVNYQMVW
jgi:hypothetical protein